MTVTAADHVLLTGAGFTHNFGAPLAEGIWSLILGHPAIKSTRLRDLLLNDLDYESAYHIVMSSADYVDDDREAIQQAVSAAYEYIDEIVWSWTPTGSIYGIWDFMARFAGDRSRPGYFFTLNQDLFVERHYGNSPPNAPLALLGLGRGARLQSTLGRILDSRDQITLPARMSPLTAQTGDAFYFVKLHGSCNWLASDGSQRMVIGRGKRQQIAEEPILAAYLELFEEVLFKPEATSSNRVRLSR